MSEARRTTMEIWRKDRSWRLSSSSLGSMEISRSRLPLSFTCEMVGNSSRSLRRLSAEPQFVLANDREGYRQGHDFEIPVLELQFGLVRSQGRNVFDAVRRILDIVPDARGIGERRQFDFDEANAFGCGCDDPLHTRKPDDALLHATIDVLLDFPGRIAGEGRENRYHMNVDFCILPDGEARSGDDSADDEDQHEQIGDDRIPGEVRDHRSRFRGTLWLCC